MDFFKRYLDEIGKRLGLRNGEIADLNRTLEAKNRKIEALKSRIETRESRIETLDAQIDRLKSKVSTLKVRIDVLNAQAVRQRLRFKADQECIEELEGLSRFLWDQLSIGGGLEAMAKSEEATFLQR